MKVLAIIMDSGHNPLLKESMQWLKQLFADKGIEVSEICIENDSLKGCVACGKCYRAGKCIFDDEVNIVIRQMADCDGMVVGGEILYGKLSEKCSSFLERLFHAGTAALARKPASTVLYSRRRTDASATAAVMAYFSMANMPAAYVQQGHVIYDEAGSYEVLSAVVSQMTWLLKCMEAGKKEDVDFTDGAPKRMLDYVR